MNRSVHEGRAHLNSEMVHKGSFVSFSRFINWRVAEWNRDIPMMLCGLRKEGRNNSDDGPYTKEKKDSAASDGLSKRCSLADEQRGVTTVELIKKEGSSLGLTISGGCDKDGKPKVSNLRPGGLAARSDQLNVGDYIKSVNGINLSKLRHDEIISMLKNIGERVVLEVEYELPPFGGFHEDWHKARPLVVTYVRPGGPADREGTLRAGDRVLSVNGVALNRQKHADALTLIMQSGHKAFFLIEYDIAVMGEQTRRRAHSVQKSSGPLQVEISRTTGSVLGLSLTSSLYRNNKSLQSRRSKLLVLPTAIDGMSTEHCSLMEAQQLLSNSCELTKLEILPSQHSVSVHDTVRVQKSGHRPWDSSENYITAPPPFQKTPSAWSHTTPTPSHCRSVTSGSSTNTSGFQSYNCGTQYPNNSPTTPCPPTPPALAVRSLRGDPGEETTRAPVVHIETSEVVLRGDPLIGFGIQLQGGVFATEPLSAPACIRFIEPDTPAERCGVLQVGDRLLSINGIPTDDGTLEKPISFSEMLRTNKVYAGESVIPSSGTFQVKMPKRRGVELGITISGTLEPGDRLLAIDNVRLDNCGMDEAMMILQQAEGMVKLRIQKDEDNLGECSSRDTEVHSESPFRAQRNPSIPSDLQLDPKRPRAQVLTRASTHMTPSGQSENCNDVLKARLCVCRTGALHIGDRVLAINNMSLKGKPLSEAIHLLQTAGDTVTLKIKKRSDPMLESDRGSPSRSTSCVSDAEDDQSDSLRRGKYSELRLTTPPSLDSAMDSWDSSALDPGYGSQDLSVPHAVTTTIQKLRRIIGRKLFRTWRPVASLKSSESLRSVYGKILTAGIWLQRVRRSAGKGCLREHDPSRWACRPSWVTPI
ncbi:Glutamate receptor-interacting protein 2 [Triplophysa tibetana]|uniref:Glutamate receptor-interacting protein 2 n=1 Tax=Triplophysa tibetana TaxID=1572043 RepID=A0A5A9NYN2_9TELE|nr:Glutamate receptor-interacting protein 2 [Triplophysa tibetana]